MRSEQTQQYNALRAITDLFPATFLSNVYPYITCVNKKKIGVIIWLATHLLW